MKLGIIGYGNMAAAIMEGMLKSDFISAKEVIIARRNRGL